MVILNTIKVKSNFLNLNHPQTYLLLSFVLLIISIGTISLNEEFFHIILLDTIFSALIITSSIVLIFSVFILKFSKENLEIIKTGYIKITTDKFILNNYKKIPFDSIIDIKIIIGDYKGKIKYHSDLESGLSSGTENFMIIATHHEKIKKRFLVESEREINLLHNFLSHQIVKNKFQKVNIKKLVLIFDSDFRKSKEARDYIASKIKEKKLNSTEGLLMMNYNSDSEACKLRKIYNL